MWAGQVTSPSQIDLIEVPTPGADNLLPGEVIVRMHRGGICGSDLPAFTTARTFDGSYAPPGVPLHEIVGIVTDTRHSGLDVGDYVVGWAGKNDSLAEYVVTHGEDLAVVRDMDPNEAVMAQPLACVFAVLERVATPWIGEHVAVLGLGPIGLLFADVLASRGAREVTGVDPVRRVASPSMFGVDNFIENTAENWALGLADLDRPALVIEVIGHQMDTLGAAIDAVAPWGGVYYFGVPETQTYPLSMVAMLRKHLTLQSGTTARDRRRHLETALDYLRSKPHLARDLITDVFPVSEAQHAYTLAAQQLPLRGKVLLDFGRVPA